MKRLSRSITVGVALTLMVLVGLTGSAGAAKSSPAFNVGSVAYTATSTPTQTATTQTTSTQSKLEAFDLNWTDYRPDTACIGVWNSEKTDLLASTCQSVKGSEQKFPQNLYVSGLVPALTSGTSYNLRVDLIRHSNVIASSGFCPITGGTSSSSSPQ